MILTTREADAAAQVQSLCNDLAALAHHLDVLLLGIELGLSFDQTLAAIVAARGSDTGFMALVATATPPPSPVDVH